MKGLRKRLLIPSVMVGANDRVEMLNVSAQAAESAVSDPLAHLARIELLARRQLVTQLS